MSIQFDKNHLYHPYSSIIDPDPVYEVEYAKDCNIFLSDGTILVDGMSSWWASIHGYNNSILNSAIYQQVDKFAHVMFGGFTHKPAIELGKKLIEITHPKLDKIFYADSGSVAMEVSLKMAIQYWYAKGNAKKNKILTVKKGYHGDTFATMSLCDPDAGMHKIFSSLFHSTIFAPAPNCKFEEDCINEHVSEIHEIIKNNHQDIAAFVIEPIVQNAGGLNFYSPKYLKKIKELCDEFNILLIFDEIATGFGRTGKLFAYEYSGICPDILCLGKALTGGYMTMSVVMTTDDIACGIYGAKKLPIMHGPTFMANALAASVALASINLLIESNWQSKVINIEKYFNLYFAKHKTLKTVKDIRILGAIAVIELENMVNLKEALPFFVANGVWLRPFRNLIYVIPPYIITESEIEKIASTIYQYIEKYC